MPSHFAVYSALRPGASMDRGRRTLRAEELAGDVQGLASYDDDLLAVEQLLGDRGGQATEKVPLAVDDLCKLLAWALLPLGLASNSQRGSAASTSPLSWMHVLAQQGRTYDDRLECRHGYKSGGCAVVSIRSFESVKQAQNECALR